MRVDSQLSKLLISTDIPPSWFEVPGLAARPISQIPLKCQLYTMNCWALERKAESRVIYLLLSMATFRIALAAGVLSWLKQGAVQWIQAESSV